MKKLIALVMALCVCTALFCVSACAEMPAMPERFTLKVVFPVIVAGDIQFQDAHWQDLITCDQLAAAIDSADPERIAEGTLPLDVNRVTVLEQQDITSQEELLEICFKVWGTRTCTVAVFFRPENEQAWELYSCGIGDVVEVEFPCSGSYAVVQVW